MVVPPQKKLSIRNIYSQKIQDFKAEFFEIVEIKIFNEFVSLAN